MKRLPKISQVEVDDYRAVAKSKVVDELDHLLEPGQIVCPVQRRYVERVRRFIVNDDGLVAEADVLKRMVEDIESHYFYHQDEIDPLFKTINGRIAKIFNYDGFRDRKKCGGEWLMRILLKNIKYCPYCNAETVYSISRTDKGDIKSSFDHFYPQGRYPFLAISLYNLIPSCYRCNSQFKRDHYEESLETFHPYLDDVDEQAEFVLNGLTDEMLKGKADCSGLKILLKPLKEVDECQVQVKIDKYNVLFAVNDVYTQLFADDALRIVELARVFNQDYIDQVKKWFSGAGLEVDFERILFGTPFCRKKIENYRHSKLTLDLFREYGVKFNSEY